MTTRWTSTGTSTPSTPRTSTTGPIVWRPRRRPAGRPGPSYLFVVAPDKHTIYGEGRIPITYRRRGGPSRLDQLQEYMEAEGRDVRVLDLRPALREADRRFGTLWYETDSHWNAAGAAVDGQGDPAVAGAIGACRPAGSRSPAARSRRPGRRRRRGPADRPGRRDPPARPPARGPGRRPAGRPRPRPGTGRRASRRTGRRWMFEHAAPDAPATAPVILYVHDSTGVAVRAGVWRPPSRRLVAIWDRRLRPGGWSTRSSRTSCPPDHRAAAPRHGPRRTAGPRAGAARRSVTRSATPGCRPSGPAGGGPPAGGRRSTRSGIG